MLISLVNVFGYILLGSLSPKTDISTPFYPKITLIQALLLNLSRKRVFTTQGSINPYEETNISYNGTINVSRKAGFMNFLEVPNG